MNLSFLSPTPGFYFGFLSCLFIICPPELLGFFGWLFFFFNVTHGVENEDFDDF